MRRTPPAAFLLLALAFGLMAGSALAVDPYASLPLTAGKTSWGTKRPFNVDDGGNQYVIVTGTDGGAVPTAPSPGHWDCATTATGIITSTGSTNHGSINTLSGYVVGTCTSAAYVGGPTYYVNDGGAGNAATCASRDAGAVFNEACPLRAANERWYIDLRNTNYNSIGATSVSGTSVCSVATCAN